VAPVVPAGRRRRAPAWWAALALFAATLALYAPVRHHQFIDYDDPLYVTENARVRAGLTPDGARWAFTTTHAGNWHPLTWLSHMLDVQLFGLDAGRHHLAGAALHALNAALLLLVLAAATGALAPAALAAALFAVHPLRVPSVAWAAERKDVLSALFFLLALAAYLAHARRPGARRLAAAVALFALGLLAKPMLVTLPLLLLVLDAWPLGRARGAGGSGPGRTPWPALVLEKAPFFALAAASAVVTWLAQHRGGAILPIPLADRLANAPVAALAYLGSAAWPARLAFFYPFPRAGVPAAAWTAALAALAGLGALAWRQRRERPYLLAGWAWYLLALLPVIGLVHVGDHARADRYTYLPLIGPAFALCWLAATAARRRPRLRGALALVAVALLVALSAATRRELAYWKDGPTLFARALAVTTGNFVAHGNLGALLLRDGDVGAALPHLEEAVRLRPAYYEGLQNLAVARARTGRTREAVDLLQRALAVSPDQPVAHFNLGQLLASLGDREGARRHFQRALELRPGFAEAARALAAAR
jgi:tetratricopeptide (TPR) repeat protein